MSRLLGRIAKFSPSHGLCFTDLRRLSTATPYLLLDETNHKAARRPWDGEMVVDMNLYDPMIDERVKIPDQTLSKELLYSVRIGTSRGWVGMKNIKDFTVHLTNIFNPCASAFSHKVITLPPLDDNKARISSISLSASPNQQQEEDCVVAAKSCSSPFISLCRPGDSDWTRIEVPFFAPNVSYSTRDQRFYLYWGGKEEEEYNGPIDLVNASSGFPQVSLYQSFPNSEIPKSRQDQVISTFKTRYMVESPSGDSFIVYWCAEFLSSEGYESTSGNRPPYKMTSYKRKPRGFVVFRQDPEQKIGSYTEDIGDLCIFLGKNEAFCLSATEYPGLNPNSIYYARWDTGFSCYDLSSNTLHDLIDGEAPISRSYMWLAPLQ